MAQLPDGLDSPELIEDTTSIRAGEVNNAETHLLPPMTAAKLLNISLDVDGRRQKISGVLPMGSAGTGNPNGLFSLEAPLQNVRVLVGQWGSNIYSTPGDSVLTRRASSVSLYDTYGMGVQGRGATNTASLFITSCVAATANVSLPYSNLLCLDRSFSFTEIANVRARSLAWFNSRLWAFNSANTLAGPDYLLYSNPLDGRNWSNGQTVQVDPDTGDAGVAIVPLRDQTPRLFLFKERSIHLLEIYWTTDGYFTTTGNTLDYTKSQLRPITYEAGCVATRSVLWVPGQQQADVLFLSRDGIRNLNRSLTDAQGGAGLPLSFRIKQTIDRINWPRAHTSSAACFDGVAYFAVPVDGADNPNLVIAYDVFRDAFWESDRTVSGWVASQLTSDRKLFFMYNTAVTESYTGSNSGATYGYHLYQNDSGTANPGGSPIDMDEFTKAYTFPLDDNPASGLSYRKRWNWLDLSVQAAGTSCTLTVSYKVDEADSWTFIQNVGVAAADANPVLPVQLPFGFLSSAITHKRIFLSPISPGYKLQFRIRDQSSFAQVKIINMSLSAFPLYRF